MQEKLKELLSILDKKADKNDLSNYEEGMRDLLSCIIYEDGYGIDELIEATKE